MLFSRIEKGLRDLLKDLQRVNQGSERQNDFSKVTRMVTGEAGI